MADSTLSKTTIWLAVIAIIFGLGISLLLVVRLNPLKDADSKKENEAVKAKPLGDTVVVKLLNNGPVKADTIQKEKSQKQDVPVNSVDSLPQEKYKFAYEQTGRRLPVNSPDTISLTSGEQGAIVQFNSIRKKTNYVNTWIVMLCIAVVVTIIFSTRMYGQKLETGVLANSMDDPNLIKLINRNEKKIISLNNHRKIIRFVNKVKFQYYFLEGKNVLTDEKSEDFFLNTLLEIEKNIVMMDTDKYTTVQIQQALSNNLNQSVALKHDALLKEIVKLNANVLG